MIIHLFLIVSFFLSFGQNSGCSGPIIAQSASDAVLQQILKLKSRIPGARSVYSGSGAARWCKSSRFSLFFEGDYMSESAFKRFFLNDLEKNLLKKCGFVPRFAYSAKRSDSGYG